MTKDIIIHCRTGVGAPRQTGGIVPPGRDTFFADVESFDLSAYLYKVEAPAIIKKPEVSIDADLLAELKALTYQEGQVVVHCLYLGLGFDAIRIWPSTFLFDLQSPHRSDLVHAEKISLAPTWTPCRIGLNRFTLIFSGLPEDCETFDLIERCEGEGAFIVKGIARNDQDVYYVQINADIQFNL